MSTGFNIKAPKLWGLYVKPSWLIVYNDLKRTYVTDAVKSAFMKILR